MTGISDTIPSRQNYFFLEILTQSHNAPSHSNVIHRKSQQYLGPKADNSGAVNIHIFRHEMNKRIESLSVKETGEHTMEKTVEPIRSEELLPMRHALSGTRDKNHSSSGLPLCYEFQGSGYAKRPGLLQHYATGFHIQ